MNHYVLGFYFNADKNRVLLVEKQRPEWMKGKWNGIGGHVEAKESAHQAMCRESAEEAGAWPSWIHTITFTCPGGTVFVFKAFARGKILWTQREDEPMEAFSIYKMPLNRMKNLDWLIHLSLGAIVHPVMIEDRLGH